MAKVLVETSARHVHVSKEDLEKEFVKIFKSDKLPLVQFSPQNIDRFVTVFNLTGFLSIVSLTQT